MAVDPARAKTLFLNASDLADPAERAAYLDFECGDDAELRGRVEALLAADGPSGPGPETEATGVFQPTPTEAIGATREITPETLSESRVSDPDPGLATVAAIEAGGEPVTLAGVPPAARAGGFVPGRVIGGRYTLLEVLGEGGMGTVYRAEQSQPVRRMVALKLIKVGMDSRTVLARFDAERQALAMMDHPNIARVYDGGATDAGQPFFVMEFVQGVPITDYCDQHRLSVDARLQLFVAACQAVQHAHQKGIIHRDLKPSNVMVTEVDGRPTPKVIDFGVAKATEASLTDQSLGDTGAIVGTPTYMSPEQADPSSMDIDTRTDVYALGVILYELLAGSTPLDATQFKRGALLEMLRMVREVDPSKPSTKVSTADALPSIAANRGIDPGQLKRELTGDLDWIVMKALEKDRTRRYETAIGLGADLLRHLASEPVMAAPPSRSYRLRKFARKHRAGVVAASLVALALVAGVAGTTWGLFEARRSAAAERRAKLDAQANEKKAVAAAEEERKAKETVEDVLGFVENKVFAAARPKGQEGGLGYVVTLSDAITASLPSIGKDFAARPLTEARLRRTIGKSFRYLGKPELAREQNEVARSIYRRVLGPDHPDTLTSMNNLASTYGALGRHAEALKLGEETLALSKAGLGPDHPRTIASMGNLANALTAAGRTPEALPLLEKRSASNPQDMLASLRIAALRAWLGQGEEFAAVRRRALALARGADDVVMAERVAKLSSILPAPDRAELDAALARTAAKPGDEAPYRPFRLLALGMAAYRAGDDPACDEALLAADEAGKGIPAVAGSSAFYRAMSLHRRGRVDEARTLATGAAATMKPLPADAGNPLAGGGSHDDLILWLAYKEARALIGFNDPVTLTSLQNLARSHAASGRHAEAVKLHEEALALLKARLGPDHPETLNSMSGLALSYLAAGRTPEARTLLETEAAADPRFALPGLRLAALEAWSGRREGPAANRRRLLDLGKAKGNIPLYPAEQTVRALTLIPSADPEALDAAVALARRVADQGKENPFRDYFLLALGMAEYRAGHFAEADAATLAALKTAIAGHADIPETASFYRALSLFRLGKPDEARRLAVAASATMKPLPAGGVNSLTGGIRENDLILWLACKEAKALIGFDAPPAAPARPAGK